MRRSRQRGAAAEPVTRDFGRPSSISVVIAAYKALPEIDTQLEALAAQDFDGEFEVIISDNFGEAGLREHIETHPLRDRLRLRCVDSSELAGTSHARNVGSRASTMEFIAYCDQDDAVYPSWLSAMADTAANHGMVGGLLERDTLNAPDVAQWRALPPADKLPVLAHFLPITFGANMGIWRSVFDEIGGWDDTYPTAGSDVDICWRAQLAGHTLGYNQKALVAYRYRTTMGEMFDQAVSYNVAEARLSKQYAAHGARGSNPLILIGYAGWLLLWLPVLPWNWSSARRGQFMWVAGAVTGRLRGSRQYRHLYL
ncbi:glycosyltransferase family 2 protein [Rhodococcus sp. NPDC058514]|uniref:glycosyltransferase family 2 protein n=1 Tax=unclassified Rhodococcus (in: high G+C Gram-positive bacteria) TaxID=192944 RepID=UPI0036473E93